MRRNSHTTVRLGYLALMVVLAIGLTGCRGRPSSKPPIHPNPNMDHQFKYKAQSASPLFDGGGAMRPKVEGTVARGFLREDTRYYEGKDGKGDFIAKSPVKPTTELLERGQERYEIYCSPCHNKIGNGQGIITKHGLVPPPPFHGPDARVMTDGEIFSIISNGSESGRMSSYKHQVSVEDRWAIVAYIRALQRSQSAKLADVPKEERAKLK